MPRGYISKILSFVTSNNVLDQNILLAGNTYVRVVTLSGFTSTIHTLTTITDDTSKNKARRSHCVKQELQLPCRFTSEDDGAILSQYASHKLNKQELGHNV